MRRNTAFRPEQEPFRDDDALQIQKDRTRGAVPFFNPTHAHFDVLPSSTPLGSQGISEVNPSSTPVQSDLGVVYTWTARNNRKGRHAILLPSQRSQDPQTLTPRPTARLDAVLHGIRRMATYYPVWDISYLYALVYTYSCMVTLVTACLLFIPAFDPDRTFEEDAEDAVGILTFMNATTLAIATVLLVFETLYEQRMDCFGWSLERWYNGEGDEI